VNKKREGTYSQLNLRNNFNGDTVLGTNVEITGSGVVNFGPVSDLVNSVEIAPAGSRIVLGNLRIGAGQTAAVNKNGGASQIVRFSSVTLTGGSATFSPKTPNFGFGAASDLALGPVSETTAGSGFVMAGDANLYLTSANSFTGSAEFQRGTTYLGAAGALPATSALVMSGGTLNFDNGAGASFNQTVASLSGTDGIITNAAVDTRDFSVNQSANTIFGGSIQGALNFAKAGAGTLRLTKTNFFGGVTTIAAGTLSVSNGMDDGAINGPVTVQSGASLIGHGGVGALTVAGGGRVNPGDDLGTLVAGDTAFQTGSVLGFDLRGTIAGTSCDQLSVLGTLTLNGSVQLELTLGFQPAMADTFTLILNDNAEAIIGGGRFVYGGNVLENGEIFAAASGPFAQLFEIRYDGTDGNDVVLNAVPEPAVGVFLLAGLAVCTRRRRS
jgi:autotransporter-associated beta strand protein